MQTRSCSKHFICGILCLIICISGCLTASQAETGCLCKRADPVTVPGPTPKPMPLREGGVPAMSLYLRGVPAKEWTEDFFRYLYAHDIPVSEQEFEFITEFENQEAHGVVFSRHRLVAGGAEIFIQLVDYEIINEWVVIFENEAATTEQLRETLLYYFPLVMEACIYASEETITIVETQSIVKMLHPDIRSMVLLGEDTKTQIRPNRTYYTLHNESSSSFSSKYEYLRGYGSWE